jgi:hypothetical protein
MSTNNKDRKRGLERSTVKHSPLTMTETNTIDDDFDLKHYEEVARKSRAVQGLPPKIVDPLVLKRIADLLKP